jgi:hypothetical protein
MLYTKLSFEAYDATEVTMFASFISAVEAYRDAQADQQRAEYEAADNAVVFTAEDADIPERKELVEVSGSKEDINPEPAKKARKPRTKTVASDAPVPAVTQEQADVPMEVTSTAPAIANNDLAKAASLACRKLASNEPVKQLLAKYGVDSVSKIPQDQRRLFLDQVGALAA